MSEEVRIGVYVCHCGGNISDYVDVKKVVEAIKDEPGVVVAKDVMFACADSSQNEMIEDIKKYNLNRLIVASCSPKLHELTFRGVAARAGLNKYTYYHANIREQSSWAHTDDKEGATIKAIRHVRAAIAYARLAEPLESIKTSTVSKVLVIGGGIAGLRAALDLADAGLSVYIVEKDPFVGGRAAQLSSIYPSGKKGYEIVSELINEVLKRENIMIYTNAEIKELSGYVGNFEVKIRIKPRYFKGRCDNIEEIISKLPKNIPDEFNYGLTKRTPVRVPPYPGAYPEIPHLDIENCDNKCMEVLKECDKIDFEMKEETITLKIGAIVVATGFDPYDPKEGEFGYGSYDNVITLPQLHRLIELNKTEKLIYNGKEIKRVAFIYCVGSRQTKRGEEEVNEYCSRYCCKAAIYASLNLLKRFNGLKIYHFFRDIRTYGREELLYEEASKNGVIFIKYDENDPPKVIGDEGRLIVKSKDLLTPLEEEIEIPVDMVVLVTGMVPRKNNEELYKILKLSTSRDRFLLEVHPKLKPVETAITGIFIAGACQAPKDTIETLSSASAAASKAATLTMVKTLELEPFVAHVDPEKCELSKLCIDECEYGAIEIKEYEGIGKKAWVNEAKCKGCGACVAVCPTEAIQLKGLSNRQIREMIVAMGKEVKI
ncbi:CoB--CoM heterodisulfide reductase iron-sulfur subunit A family protein [Candidatus Geothermarchaeota archaeon]|nr:MAG: CoB--CoM heterodisulfide reductase iron-sulfur subunit A family protein [Candidatus Geothermarchaeota archaeon]HEW94154.1 CoB--CoM heterodisulfide reductase iron-sulfur subunit A family protein [Thermoprotei archaeon]